MPTGEQDMRRPLIFAVALLAVSTTAGAGELADWPSTAGARFRIDAPLQLVDDLTGRCPPRRKGVCESGTPATRERCRVEDVRELGVFGSTRYLLVRARRERAFEAESEAGRSTIPFRPRCRCCTGG